MQTRRRALALVVALTLAAPGLAWAGKGSEKETQIDFNTLLINGEVRKPSIEIYNKMGRPKFEKLLSLQRSFRPEIVESAKDPALK